MHAVLSAVDLQAATAADQALLAATRRVAGQRGRFVGERVDVLPKAWHAWVLDDHGRVQRTRYELGLWYAARDALRAGRVFRPVGRRYADPAAFLLPAERWARERDELAITFDRPLAADERLRQLETEQRAALAQLQTAVDAGDGVRLAGDRLEVLPPAALPEDPPSHGCRRTWSGCARACRSPTCSPTSAPGPTSPVSSPTPPAPRRACGDWESICSPRCWPGA